MEPLGINGTWATPRGSTRTTGGASEWFRAGDLDGPRLPDGHRAGQLLGLPPRGNPGHPFRRRTARAGEVRELRGGAVLDVVVDLRAGSPTFAAWTAIRLDDESRRAVFLAEGLGHAFMALSEQATVLYLCSTPYAPGREHSVDALDPDIGIEWPVEVKPILSDKDAAAPSLRTAQGAGILPDYARCLSYTAQLRGPLPAS